MPAYDAHAKSSFKLRGMLLWTINDFPAFGNLSGMSTKGKYACPSCHMDTWSHRLVNGHKYCYMGHRRFLPTRHSWKSNAKSFDGQKERHSAPKALSGDDIMRQYLRYSTNYDIFMLVSYLVNLKVNYYTICYSMPYLVLHYRV